jgi:ubiquinone/menaquinone biosynthesis C-methylase UbiE
LNKAPPNYESYDYSQEWEGKKLNDLAEKSVIRSWIKPAQSCLELGGGFGRITKLLQTCFADVVSIDFSKRNLRRASQELSPFVTSLIRGDIRSLPFENDLFDLVIMIRVAHHLPDPSVVLDEIHRVAKNRATIIISIPNPLFSKGGRDNQTTLLCKAKSGHEIYSVSFKAYSHTAFSLVEMKGTGIFERKIARWFEPFPYLYLTDAITSRFWYLKPNLFLRFEIRK